VTFERGSLFPGIICPGEVSGRAQKCHKLQTKLCMAQTKTEAATIVSMDVTALYCAKNSLCLRNFELANDTSMLSASSVSIRQPTAMRQRIL
jgi:hypothetical protein